MNLLLVIADSVRADYVGCSGNPNVNAPTIDWLCRNGVRFENAIPSAAWTLPSIYSIISGVNSHKFEAFEWFQPIDKNTKTLFHYFLENGYLVSSFVFDEKHLFSNMKFTHLQGNSMKVEPILNWIDCNKERNFFLFIHSWWTHVPYGIKKSAKAWTKANQDLLGRLRNGTKDDIEYCKKLYIKSIENFSENFMSKIIERLKKNNILNETFIIFMADHGETWGERLEKKDEISNNIALHGRYMYDEGLKIAMIFYCPKKLPRNKVVKNQVRTIDITPTIIDIFDFNYKKEGKFRNFDGRSMMNLILNRKEKEDRMAIISTSDAKGKKIIHKLTKMSVRFPPWKFIWTLASDKEELYNIKKDPGETMNVRKEFLEVASILKDVLKKELHYAPINNLPDPLREEYSIKKSIRFLSK